MSIKSDRACTFIIYACPVGELADQIDHYYAVSQAICGPNASHSYMPHCSLTGFFHDEQEAVGRYIEALDTALRRARAAQPIPVLAIEGIALREDFHGLLLSSPWLKGLIGDFARTLSSPTRRDTLRLKDWLHLSLAYAFPPKQHTTLAELARKLVDIKAPVSWELRFYERHVDGSWACHAGWPL
jgi:hypothetical protein